MDYLQIAISYGYMILFIAPLPALSFLVCLFVWSNMRGDSWKLCKLFRRPWPDSAEDIGTWQSIFELLSSIAVITNGALIIFTMNIFVDYTLATRFWIYIIFQWVIFTFQFIIRAVIPDIPKDIAIQKERQEYLNRVLVKREINHDADDNQKKNIIDVSEADFGKFVMERLNSVREDKITPSQSQALYYDHPIYDKNSIVANEDHPLNLAEMHTTVVTGEETI